MLNFKRQTPANKATYLFAFVLFVIAPALVAYGVISQRGKEPTLMKVCWNGAVAVTNCDGSTATALRWQRNQFPLDVAVRGEQRVADRAIKFWNQSLGFTAFRRYSSSDERFPTVTLEVALTGFDASAKEGGHTSFAQTDRLTAAAVVYQLPSMSEEDRACEHELGHVLGLAHDPNDEESVMYPDSSVGVDENAHIDTADVLDALAARVTDADRKALRKLYH